MNRVYNIYSGATYVENMGSQTVNNIGTHTVNNINAPVAADSQPEDVSKDTAVCDTADTAEEPPSSTDLLPLSDADKRVRGAIEYMVVSGVMANAYDYAWVCLLFMDNKTHKLPLRFDTASSFLHYLNDRLGMTERPAVSSLNRKIKITRGMYPNWNFDDADSREARRRNDVAACFLRSYRLGLTPQHLSENT